MNTRVVYKNGIVRPESKGLEIECRCNCEGCRQRYETTKHREYRYVSHRNTMMLTVWYAGKEPAAIKFAEQWKCKDGSKELPPEYIVFDLYREEEMK